MFIRCGFTARCILVMLLVLLLQGCSHIPTVTSHTTAVETEQKDQLASMKQTSEELFALSKEGNVVEVREKLLTLEKQVIKFRFYSITTIEGVHVLSEAIIEAKRVYNAFNFIQDRGIVAVARIYLGIDALTHPSQPMWLEHYDLLINDLNQMKMAAVTKQLGTLQARLKAMNGHYSIIRPSIMISWDDTVIEQIDSLFIFATNQLNANVIDYTTINSGIDQFYHLWDQVFKKNNTLTLAPVLQKNEMLYWTTAIGFFIIMTLTYVGWRKYQVQRDYIAVHSKHDSR